MSIVYRPESHSRRRVPSATIESRLLFAVLYPVCLVRAGVARLIPKRMSQQPIRESIFAEARSRAGTIVAWSFMGL